jgi:hypothetical protein
MRNLVKIRESMLKGVARPSAGLFAMLMIFGSVAVMSAPERECRFADILVSHGPSPQVSAGAAAVFDWLVGDWEADVYDYGPGGSKRVSKGEWHFSWILEGGPFRIYGSFPSGPTGMQRHPAITIDMAQPFAFTILSWMLGACFGSIPSRKIERS